jgi:hypothetical protein
MVLDQYNQDSELVADSVSDHFGELVKGNPLYYNLEGTEAD